MKAIPILVITNALALALAIFLFVKQGSLETQLSSRRSDVSARSDAGDASRLALRIDELERRLEAQGAGLAARDAGADRPAAAGTTGEGGAPAFAAPESEEGTGPAVEPGAGVAFEPQEMEVFRQKVRKALELNAEEDQVTRVAERLDQLVEQNRIAPLSPRQKEAVARIYLEHQRRMPMVWQKLRESGAFENTPREQRGELVRAEYDNLRAEAQRALEDLMPAADAKTIVDEALAQRGFGGPGPAPFGGGRRGAPGR